MTHLCNCTMLAVHNGAVNIQATNKKHYLQTIRNSQNRTLLVCICLQRVHVHCSSCHKTTMSIAYVHSYMTILYQLTMISNCFHMCTQDVNSWCLKKSLIPSMFCFVSFNQLLISTNYLNASINKKNFLCIPHNQLLNVAVVIS